MKKRFFLSLLLLSQSSAFAQLACPTVKYDWTVTGYADPLAVDSKGNLYGESNGVSKRSPSGDLLWTYAPTPYTQSVAVDSQDNVYVGGTFSGTVDFDPGPDSHDLTAGPYGNSFLVKLTPMGDFLWAFVDTDYYVSTRNISVDSNNYVVLAGGGQDIALAKFSPDGQDLWHYRISSVGNRNDLADSVATDADNNVYIGGYFTGFINLNPDWSDWPDWHDAFDCPDPIKSFVTKFSPDGDYLWSRSFECSAGFSEMDVNPDGSVIVVGYASAGSDLDPTEGVNLCQEPGMFITKLGSDGSYLWSYFATTPLYNTHLSLFPNGDILVYIEAGSDVDFDPTEGVLDSHCGRTRCWFILYLDSEANPRWVKSLLDTHSYDLTLTVSASGDIFLTNIYYHTIAADLDPTCGEDLLEIGPSHQEGFITKLSCITHPGDIDDDGDVDLRDLAAFQNCFEGSDRDTCSPGCDAFDLRPDNALDLLDFSLVSPSVTGPK